MSELIVIDKSGVALLNDDAAAKIADFELKAKQIKDAEEALKAAILKEMKANGIIKIDMPQLLINYIEPTMRETFDSKAFRQEFPEIYDSFVKLSPVKESIRVKVK